MATVGLAFQHEAAQKRAGAVVAACGHPHNAYDQIDGCPNGWVCSKCGAKMTTAQAMAERRAELA